MQREKYYKIEVYLDFDTKQTTEYFGEFVGKLPMLDKIRSSYSGNDIFYIVNSQNKKNLNKLKNKIYLRINDEVERKLKQNRKEYQKLKNLKKSKGILVALRSKKLKKINERL